MVKSQSSRALVLLPKELEGRRVSYDDHDIVGIQRMAPNRWQRLVYLKAVRGGVDRMRLGWCPSHRPQFGC
jgi:hypothetical protein